MELEILNLLLVLLSAWLGGGLATRLGYPAILGELAAGIILGPGLIGLLEFNETIGILSEIGVLLMMLFIGMEVDYKELGKASWAALLAASGGFVVPFVLGYYAIIMFGGTTNAALFTAIAVGVTSLATKSRILVDLKLLHTRVANVLMAGALISDTMALLIFAGIMSFADVGNVNVREVSIVAGKAVLFFLSSGLIGMYGLPWLARWIEKLGFANRTLYFTVMLAVGLGFAEMAELAGLHHILGAFIAGLFLKDIFPGKRLNKNLNDTFHDFSIGFLAPIFFVSAGFAVTFDVITEEPVKLVTILLLATLGKIVGTALFYLPSRHGWREGLTVGAGMNGRGAVEIIIAGIGLKAGYLDNELFSILVFMAIFTTATVPVLLRITTEWLRRRNELVLATGSKTGFLFMGGGPVAELLAQKLQEKTKVILIDTNRDNCKRLKKAGLNCIHGNALNEEVLVEAGAGSVNTFVSMTGNSEINVLAAQHANEKFLIPHIHVVISKEGEDSLINLIEMARATTLFAMRTEIERWDYKIVHGEYEIRTFVLKEENSTRQILKQIRTDEGGELLPLYYEDATGSIDLVHYGLTLEEGSKLYYLI